MADPPRLISWLLDLFVPTDQADSIPGDLVEEFTAKAAQAGARAARRWYRRQAVSTIAHLLRQQYRASPWATIGAVLVGLVILPDSEKIVHLTAGVFLEHFRIYPYVPARIMWLIYGVGLECIVCPLIAGWIAAAISKGREMAVALTLSALRGSAVIPWLIFVLWRHPLELERLLIQSDAFYTQSLLTLLLPPIWLFLGAVICKRRRIPERPAPAVS
jgi:hypothetical protein